MRELEREISLEGKRRGEKNVRTYKGDKFKFCVSVSISVWSVSEKLLTSRAGSIFIYFRHIFSPLANMLDWGKDEHWENLQVQTSFAILAKELGPCKTIGCRDEQSPDTVKFLQGNMAKGLGANLWPEKMWWMSTVQAVLQHRDTWAGCDWFIWQNNLALLSAAWEASVSSSSGVS